MAVTLYAGNRARVSPAGPLSPLLSKVQLNAPAPLPTMLKRGSNVPRAYVFTGTGPGNGDTACMRYDCLVNPDGTLALTPAGNPQIDTTTGVSVGSPGPPVTRSISVNTTTSTVTISGWIGGAKTGRWVGIPANSNTGLSSGTYYAINPSGNSCQLVAARGTTTPLTLTGGGATTTCTVRDGEPYSLDHIPEGDCTYIADTAGNGRDLFIVLPDDRWGINPQTTPLVKPAGIFIAKGYNVQISGAIDHSIDYVAADGGVGFDVSAATPTVSHSGGGYHDQKQRAIRLTDWAGTMDVRGVRITGSELYEAIDFSNGLAVGASTGVTGLGALPKFREYWTKIGDSSTGQVKNLLVRTAASQTAMLALTSTVTGDIINVTGQKSWKYLGGDRTAIGSYQDLGAVNASGQFTNHSGGDCLQCWGIISCELDVQYNEHHSTYQTIFLAWNDQLTSGSDLAAVNAGAGPTAITVGNNRLFGYGAAQSGYQIYVTKGGVSGQTGLLDPPLTISGPNTFSATYGVTDPRSLLRVRGNSPTSGTASDSNGFYQYADFTGLPGLVAQPPRPFRYLVPVAPLTGLGNTALGTAPLGA